MMKPTRTNRFRWSTSSFSSNVFPSLESVRHAARQAEDQGRAPFLEQRLTDGTWERITF